MRIGARRAGRIVKMLSRGVVRGLGLFWIANASAVSQHAANMQNSCLGPSHTNTAFNYTTPADDSDDAERQL